MFRPLRAARSSAGRRLTVLTATLALAATAAAVPAGVTTGRAVAQEAVGDDRFQAVPYRSYVPATFSQSVLQGDLSVAGIEVTQAIQCFDPSNGLAACGDNSLRLVTDKASAARIYLRSTPFRRAHVPVRLYYRLVGQSWSSVLLSGPATPSLEQGSALDSVNVYFSQFGGAATGEFYAVVDPNGTVAESNETNNTSPVTRVTFRPRRTLPVVGQRLDYHPSGYTGTRQASGWAVDGGAARWFERLLPVRENGVRYSLASGHLDWTTSLASRAGQHALISELNLRWVMGLLPWFFGPSPFTGARHVYGWAPNDGYRGGHADMPVYPHAGGLGVVGIGTDAPGTSTDDPGSGAVILGHELTHDYDVLHTNTSDACGSSDDNADFPYASSSIQEYGFNTATGTVYDPDDTHDLMSYCPPGSRRGWISPFTWERMYDSLAPAATVASATVADDGHDHVHGTSDGPVAGLPVGEDTQEPGGQESLLVDVTLLRDGGARLGTLYRAPAGATSGLDDGGTYAVVLQDRSGKELARYPFSSDFATEYSGHRHGDQPSPGDAFAQDNEQARALLTVPFAPGTHSVVLTAGQEVVDRRPVSPSAPSVDSVTPDAGEWVAGALRTVSWSGSDADGDALTYLLLASRDGGRTWEQLAGPTSETSAVLDVDGLAGGPTLFRVIASDGVNTSDAQAADTVAVPDQAPTATITQPAPGRTVPLGGLLVLEGQGLDLEDGMLTGSALQWSVDGRPVGEGGSVPLTDLPAGVHTVTLTVTDAGGRTASQDVQVVVTEVVADATAPVAEGTAVQPAARFTPVTDPSRAATCTVQYGDGSPVVAGVVEGDRCTAPPHSYRDDGVYAVVVTVAAGQEEIGTDVVEQVVTNAAPRFAAGADDHVGPAGEPVELALPFTDAGLDDVHTATVDWGDGSSGPATVEQGEGGGTVRAAHTYSGAGIWTATVTVVDDDGASASLPVDVVAPDRGPSFVTGGAQWGAERSRLTGNARYREGADRPTGTTTYAVGGHVLRSTAYDWLVVAGDRAVWSGTGTWDGAPGHGFLVALHDRGPGDDLVRVRVTAPDGTVVSDTAPGAPSSAAPTTATSGGNLTVHRR